MSSPRVYTIHWSDIQSFMSCRRKWDYASHLRRGLEWRRLYAPFFLGSAVHHGLEHMRSVGATFDDSLQQFEAQQIDKMTQGEGADALWEEEAETVSTNIEIAFNLLHHYRLWEARYKGPFHRDEIEFISYEKVFRVPLLDPLGNPVPNVFLEGRIDGVFRHLPTSQLWLYEIKTARSIHERVRLLPNDGQASTYCGVIEQMFGEPPAGVLYDIIRKAEPKIPEMTTRGTLSKNMRIKTSYDVYLNTIHELHGAQATPQFIRANYGDILDHLHDEADPFFARVPAERTPNEIARHRLEIYHIAMEMIRPDVITWAQPGWGCGFCAFKEPCLVRNQSPVNLVNGREVPSEDEALLLDANYQVRDMVAAYGEFEYEGEG